MAKLGNDALVTPVLVALGGIIVGKRPNKELHLVRRRTPNPNNFVIWLGDGLCLPKQS